jgi:hypothetical protein
VHDLICPLRRYARLVFVALLVFGLTACSGSVVTDDGATRVGGTPSAEDGNPDDPLPAVCAENPALSCAVSPDGHLVAIVRATANAGAPDAPTLLWEPGGPGVAVLSTVDHLPKWSAGSQVLLVPEPWSYQTKAFCERHVCEGSQLSPQAYRDAVAFAESTWAPIDAVAAFSFGAVRVLPLLEDAGYADRTFWIAAPAPVPGTSGAAIGRGRATAALAAISAVICQPERDTSCTRSGEAVAAFTRGGGKLSPREATLGLMGLAANAATNKEFLRRIIGTGVTELSPDEELAVGRAAFALSLEGNDSETVIQRNAYLAAICATYPGWDGSNVFSSIHSSCEDSDERMTEDPPRTPAANRVVFTFNRDDPVTPFKLQRKWAQLARASKIYTDTHLAHSLPSTLPQEFSNVIGAQ